MSQQGPRGVGDILQSGDMHRLGVEIGERRQLAARVRAALPADAAAHIVSARLDEDGHLLVGVDSAAWAARLRYSRDSLLDLPLRVRVAVPGETPG
jgi:predicted nucleic acid-binding Zn ribbon protein